MTGWGSCFVSQSRVRAMERRLREEGGSEGDVSAATVSLQPTANRVCQSVPSERESAKTRRLTQCVTISDKMLSHCLALTLLALGVTADLGDFELSETESAGDPRLFFANFTSSLVTVNSTLLTRPKTIWRAA